MMSGQIGHRPLVVPIWEGAAGGGQALATAAVSPSYTKRPCCPPALVESCIRHARCLRVPPGAPALKGSHTGKASAGMPVATVAKLTSCAGDNTAARLNHLATTSKGPPSI
eukprot:5358244-Pyramimonas_sp.AAC.1